MNDKEKVVFLSAAIEIIARSTSDGLTRKYCVMLLEELEKDLALVPKKDIKLA